MLLIVDLNLRVISVSSTASGSFNIVCANQFPTVDLTGMTGLDQSGHLSSSAQLLG